MTEILNDYLIYILLGAIAYNSLMVHLRVDQIAKAIKEWELSSDGESNRVVLE